jgi:Flp pilus assembly protein TadB
MGAAVLAELAHPGYVGAMLRAPLAPLMLGAAATLQLVACVAIRRIARMGEGRVKRPPRSAGPGR